MRLAEQGAFDRASLGENAANWRHITPSGAIHYGTEQDEMGNQRTVPYQYGRRMDQAQPAILTQVAPGGLKDANHLISTLEALPEESRETFKAEAAQAHPDLFKQAYNLLSDKKKAQGGAPAAAVPSAAARPAAPFMLPDRVKRHSAMGAYGGDIAPATRPTYGQGPYWDRGGPVITPPDTDSYARMAVSRGPLDPYAPLTASTVPASARPSMIRKPTPTPRMGGARSRKPIRPEEPEFLRQPF